MVEQRGITSGVEVMFCLVMVCAEACVGKTKRQQDHLMSKFKNCVAMPVPFVNGFERVFDLFSIAPLHLTLGITNRLLKEFQDSELYQKVEDWLTGLKVQRRKRNKQFHGPHCR